MIDLSERVDQTPLLVTGLPKTSPSSKPACAVLITQISEVPYKLRKNERTDN